ncbi:tRNA uridine-5-carboxymethylaminomethyl(34) synthesis GTPase MnmE [Palleronia rufa]|uniref:tRNA uridine-5-carboxymethylaminomethyl(34) synthesis GTPase MnmE n=1 Tax=Palleronia rufa TaxID=1530186 RepID=UPI000566D8E8|nr:tRNA uridine-5-carboxymethylaminomethyl(34) synthesis GTPase MnmE [Palleronia rufa]
MDTIFAQATAPGKAGVSIVRISGPDAFKGCAVLCGTLPQPRLAAVRRIRSVAGETLDSGLVLTFESGASFTGEDVVELQLHGSVAVVHAVLKELQTFSGFRPARAGEFTRRALDNQKLDLAQVEGLADLIDAETELQRRQAQEVLSGVLSKKIEVWRKLLVEAAALVEATLDFSDEDIPVDVTPDVLNRVAAVVSDLDQELAGYSAAERIRDGFEVAIMGPPNAGKSTLLNAIARRPVALTSEIAGTTRDVIEVRIDLQGLPVTLLDTAGLRETADPLEAAGINLARSRAQAADLRIWLDFEETVVPDDIDIILRARDDVGASDGVSGKTGSGISPLLDRIAVLLSARVPQNRLLIRARHRTAMEDARRYLEDSRRMLKFGGANEVAADALRNASASLAELVGGIDVDDLLDEIFSRFCIGK